MSTVQLLFSPFGRINRKTFWSAYLLIQILVIVALLMSESGSEDLASLAFVIVLCIAWPGYVVQLKRWHDRNKSAWWFLMNFVPYIGPLWIIIELGFLKGVPGPNQYGEPQQCEGFKTVKHKRRILIIDDEKNVTQTLIDRFEMNDFDVKAASDNDTALCLIQKRKYDLIIQDMNRPFGDCLADSHEELAGVAFYRKYIRTICPEVPVIFYSAHIHKLPNDILKSNLCTGLKIPFDLTEFFVLIKSILDQPREEKI